MPNVCVCTHWLMCVFACCYDGVWACVRLCGFVNACVCMCGVVCLRVCVCASVVVVSCVCVDSLLYVCLCVCIVWLCVLLFMCVVVHLPAYGVAYSFVDVVVYVHVCFMCLICSVLVNVCVWMFVYVVAWLCNRLCNCCVVVCVCMLFCYL